MMRSWMLIAFLALGMPVGIRAQPAPHAPEQPHGSQPIQPLNGFVANRGQWPAAVKFFASRGGIDATLVDDAIVLRPRADLETGEWPRPLTIRIPAGHDLEGQGVLPT